MYLSYLAYQCAKAAANYGDPSLNYDSFLTGQAKEDEDYSAFIEKSLPVINEFVQRAYELNKLPAKTAEISPDEEGWFDLPDDYGKGISAFYPTRQNDYANIGFRKSGKKAMLTTPYPRTGKIMLQYRGKVPYFTEADLIRIDIQEDDSVTYLCNGREYASRQEAVEDNDVELEEAYGFSDSLASICIAFCQGRLMDDRGEGHAREAEAESRLDDVTLDETLFLQHKTLRTFK